MREPDQSEKARDERHGRREQGQRTRDGGDAQRSCREYARRPPEWTEARDETPAAIR